MLKQNSTLQKLSNSGSEMRYNARQKRQRTLTQKAKLQKLSNSVKPKRQQMLKQN
jgi:hypothetical protein